MQMNILAIFVFASTSVFVSAAPFPRLSGDVIARSPEPFSHIPPLDVEARSPEHSSNESFSDDAVASEPPTARSPVCRWDCI
ncbi:hypothetical protein K435DRAFT_961535 [Dendrothele bispora CBS 962.96]|uniref:Uncharacterized protein n=1 Tax=Dendrothele bispora (strain CBS 962.96) TaxID=1314807 RepID=A0A4V4HI43_DENBC|nr:hypothetical protein K435DRAFT_961535 [Dendrothele bispora CBS 962.96]